MENINDQVVKVTVYVRNYREVDSAARKAASSWFNLPETSEHLTVKGVSTPIALELRNGKVSLWIVEAVVGID